MAVEELVQVLVVPVVTQFEAVVALVVEVQTKLVGLKQVAEVGY